MRVKEREEYWHALVERHTESGMSAAAFCKEQQINCQLFYSWRRRFRHDSSTGEFIRLVPTSNTSGSGIRILLDNAISLEAESKRLSRKRLSDFEGFGLFKGHAYPLSLCLADLDIMSRFCEGPDVFLHYIERRLAVQKWDAETIIPELEAFGAYLDTRLREDRLLGLVDKPVTGIFLDGFQERFDKWVSYERGEIEEVPDIKLEVPNEVNEILRELRSRVDDDGARWIAFSILGMSDAGLEGLARMVREVRTAQLTPGVFRRVTHKDGDTVISLVACLDFPSEMLRERTRLRTELEKYRLKAEKSIGIGIMISDRARSFDSVVWIEGPWKHDDNMEEMLRLEPPFIPVAGQKLPGRNDPCICGSGKKFKKCCLPKIESAKRAGTKEGTPD